jgi:AraC-like DNA-binding protein
VRERRYSLAQIAYLLGFADQANFTRAFKRWTGATPSEFRQN